jgi:hypothetical protein
MATRGESPAVDPASSLSPARLVLFLIVPVALALVALGVWTLRGGGPPGPPSPAVKAERKQAAEVASTKARDARREAAVQAIAALKAAIVAADRTRASAEATALARLGEDALAPAVEHLKTERTWAVRMALLDAISGVRHPCAVAAMGEVYASAKEVETALRIEAVRRLGRMAGTPTRELLAGFLATEKSEAVRGEIGKALVVLGLTPQEAAKLGERDRAVLEPQAKAREGLLARLEAVEKADVAAEAGLAVVRKTALEDDVVAVALSAFSRLEARDDAAAAGILVERVARPASTNERKIIQTNAIASLTRMTCVQARVAVRKIALGGDAELRVQAVEILGGFGDVAMLPLLDQALAMDKSERMARATERARTAIEARAKAPQGELR